MLIYESIYLKINFYAEQNLLELVWLPATQDMVAQDYKDENLVLIQKVEEMKANKVVANTKDLEFVISPELQEWINENILAKAIQLGCNKLAIVLSTEFLTQLSIEQVMEEEVGLSIITAYFDEVEEAREWAARE